MEKRFLIARWLGETPAVAIYDDASISSARQRVREVGKDAHLKAEVVEVAVLIASELTRNQLNYSRQGYFAVKVIERDSVGGLEVIAADLGPGIEKPLAALHDRSVAAAGSIGAGLGAVCRLADEVDFDNRIAEGLCVVARKFEHPVARACSEVGIMGRPYPGELISGDDAVLLHSDAGFIAAVADGLGHGPEARAASNRALELMTRDRADDLAQMVSALDRELADTRGCAMSIVRFNRNDNTLESVSLGDVHAHIYKLNTARFLTATPFILGARQFPKQRVAIEKVNAEPGAIVVIFSDGLRSSTTLKGQLDILRQPVIGIGEHLLAQHSRPDDDALALVARLR
jgi:anti-sigma regulatory factor (Ser/Thr protein kinase)